MKNLALMFLIVVLASGICLAQTSAFTYQGKLANSGALASGVYQFEFKLFETDTGIDQIGSTQTVVATVQSGSFTTRLDFGATAFPADADRWLEISVRLNGHGDPYTILTPRQQVSSVPFAVRSLTATNADNATTATTADTAMTAGNVTGVVMPANGGTGLGGPLPPADTFLRSNGAGWTAAGLIATDLPGESTSYIQNIPGIGQQSASFNISGGATANIFNAASHYNIGGNRILSSPGGDNVFAGRTAGLNSTTGVVNSFFGHRAGEANVGGSSNSFFGERSGLNSQGVNNSFVGAVAGQSNVAGGNNTIIGTLADVGSPNLNFATALGAGAVVSTSNTIALGRSNGSDSVFAPGNLTVGGTGTANRFVATTQYDIGLRRVLSIGTDNTGVFVGNGAGIFSSGGSNTLVGNDAGRNTTGSNNSFFGSFGGTANTTGSYNAFFGRGAGRSNTTGSFNSFVGSSGSSNTTGSYNSFVGEGAGSLNTTGVNNSFIGFNAGNSNTTGGNNSFFGMFAGFNNTTGSNNTLIGRLADVGSDALTFATALGAGATVSTSNTVVLGRSADTVLAPNLLQVNVLGVAGDTSLCRNAINQISTCTVGNLPEKSGENAASLNELREQLKEQQLVIDELKQIVCTLKPEAVVCRKANQ